MKLIKLNTDHYVIVTDSEIKEGDWYYWEVTKTIQIAKLDSLNRLPKSSDGSKKITHSTQPLGVKPITDKVVIQEDKAGKPLMSAQYVELDMSSTVKPLSLQEVKELIGEVDVEKQEIILTDHQKELLNIGNVSYKDSSIIYYLPYIFINQNGKWYMQFEDNKDKKYTEEDLRNAFLSGIRITGEGWNGEYADGNDPNIEDVFGESVNNFIQSLHPKTEWEVEFVDGKLKLK